MPASEGVSDVELLTRINVIGKGINKASEMRMNC